MRSSAHFLKTKEHIASVTVDAEKMGMDRKALRKVRTLSAALSVEVERQAWKRVEVGLIRQAARPDAQIELLCHLELYAYDGVDMTVSTKTKSGCAEFDLPEDVLEPALGGGEAMAVEEPPRHEVAVPDEQDVDLARLMNSMHIVTLMFKVDGRVVMLEGEASTWLQSVERYTAECIRESMKKICMSADDSKAAFPRSARLCVTDAASYNVRAERHSASGHTVIFHNLM